MSQRMWTKSFYLKQKKQPIISNNNHNKRTIAQIELNEKPNLKSIMYIYD